jgi:hypothetical protein
LLAGSRDTQVATLRKACRSTYGQVEFFRQLELTEKQKGLLTHKSLDLLMTGCPPAHNHKEKRGESLRSALASSALITNLFSNISWPFAGCPHRISPSSFILSQSSSSRFLSPLVDPSCD